MSNTIGVNWVLIKDFMQKHAVSSQFLETETMYHIYAVDGVIILQCNLEKTDPVSADQLDFETNFKAAGNKPIIPRDSQGNPINRPAPFSDAGGFRFRGASFSGTVDTGTTSSIDYKITAERYINGGRVIVDNIGHNDTLTFQVVDKDNILGYGAGVVLDEFIKDYFIPTTGSLEVKLDYPAKILANLYLRLKYTSSHESGCTVKCNLYLHWKAS